MAHSSSEHDTALSLSLSLLPASLRTPPRPRKPKPEASMLASTSRLPCSETPPCTECGKRFPSRKALFGHMRCHPERQWRGINPPPHFRSPGEAAAVTAMQFTVQECEVAASLLMLAGTRPVGGGKPNKASASNGKECMSTLGSTAKRDDHKCSICDRGFGSGQALGGHKRCHWERYPEVGAAAAVKGIALDLNLPPSPATTAPLVQKRDQSSRLNETLDLKLGY